MSKQIRARGKDLAHSVRRFRAGAGTDDLERRMAVLEEEIQEWQRDEARVAELVEKYSKGV